jgi:hypothetical protein
MFADLSGRGLGDWSIVKMGVRPEVGNSCREKESFLPFYYSE